MWAEVAIPAVLCSRPANSTCFDKLTLFMGHSFIKYSAPYHTINWRGRNTPQFVPLPVHTFSFAPSRGECLKKVIGEAQLYIPQAI